MMTVLAAVCGVIWGMAAALLNFWINKKSIEKNSTAALTGASMLRLLVDFAALGLVFLLRKVLPFSFEVMLVATAIAMSLTTIFCAYRLSSQLKPKPGPEDKPKP